MSVHVRLATSEDIPAIQAFLDDHWSKGHVLAHDRRLFDFQHRFRHRGDCVDRYSIATAWDADGALVGMLGGILTSAYDPELADRDTLWLTTWKVRDDLRDAGAGLRLHRTLSDAFPHVAIGTVGNNESAEKIYRLLGYRTGTLEQWAMIDSARATTRLARRGADWTPNPGVVDPDLRDEALTSEVSNLPVPDLHGQDRAGMRLPARSARYIADRYLRHPRYRYRVHSLQRGDRAEAWVVFRVAAHEDARAIRLVDVVGSPSALDGAAGVLRGWLETYDAEVLDLFVHGLEDDVLTRAGLTRVDPGGNTIVPSHYEPFLRKNVVLRYAYRTQNDRAMTLFKADADQDRPNQPDV